MHPGEEIPDTAELFYRVHRNQLKNERLHPGVFSEKTARCR